MVNQFVVYGLPTAKGRPRFSGKGFAYTPSKTREAERDFKVQAMEHMPNKPIEGPINLELVFYKPKPKSKPKKKWAWDTKPDIENLAKLSMDAMNKVFWRDDAQIIDLCVRKRYGEPARTEVKIEVMKNEC